MCISLTDERRKLFHDPRRIVVRPLDVEGLSVFSEPELPVERTLTLDNRACGWPAFVRSQTEPHREFHRPQDDAARIFVRHFLHRYRKIVQEVRDLAGFETLNKRILDSEAKNVHEIGFCKNCAAFSVDSKLRRITGLISAFTADVSGVIQRWAL
jgi:hypothetical protein